MIAYIVIAYVTTSPKPSVVQSWHSSCKEPYTQVLSPMFIYTAAASFHEINSHEINCHEINSQLIQAAELHFPNTQHCGCYYHFMQAIW